MFLTSKVGKMRKNSILAGVVILAGVAVSAANAQEQNPPPFTGAARTGSTYVSGVRVDVNWVYGRTSEVYVSVSGDVNTVGAQILTAVQRVTGCVGTTVRKTAAGTSEFDAVVRANCRTRWGDEDARSVQVATFSSKRAADNLFIELNLAGLLSTIQRSRSGGRTYYRVLTPAYRSPSEVSEVLAYVKGLGYRDAILR